MKIFHVTVSYLNFFKSPKENEEENKWGGGVCGGEGLLKICEFYFLGFIQRYQVHYLTLLRLLLFTKNS